MTDEIFQKLLETERRAKDIINEAKDRSEHIEEEISEEIEKMTSEYTNKANIRVETVSKIDENSANERIETIVKNTQDAKKKIHDIYEQNKDKWLENLYEKVIGKVHY